MMEFDKRKNLEALKESIAVLKQYSTSPDEEQILNKLVEDDNIDNRLDDDFIKKMVHTQYNSLAEEDEEKGIVR